MSSLDINFGGLFECSICPELKNTSELDSFIEDYIKNFRINLNSSLDDLLDCCKKIRQNQVEVNLSPLTKIATLRKELIDWLFIVCKKLELSEPTFFFSVDIFDEFIQKYCFNLKLEEFQLIASTCIFIASKINGETKINLYIVNEKILHSEFSREEILATEILILNKLNFRFNRRSRELEFFSAFINSLYLNIFPSEPNLSTISNCYCKTILFFFSKLIMTLVLLDYQLSILEDKIKIYLSVIYYSINKLDYYKKISFKLISEAFVAIMENYFSNIQMDEISAIANKIEIIYNDYVVNKNCDYVRSEVELYSEVLSSA
jgi:hypothetical protein